MEQEGFEAQGIGQHIGEKNTKGIAEQHNPEICAGAFLPKAQQMVAERIPAVGPEGGESRGV